MLQPPAPFFGRPLFRSEAARAPLPPQEFELVASSYRSVYGALLDGARRLYVIDGIALREYSYDVDGTGGRAAAVTAADRMRGDPRDCRQHCHVLRLSSVKSEEGITNGGVEFGIPTHRGTEKKCQESSAYRCLSVSYSSGQRDEFKRTLASEPHANAADEGQRPARALVIDGFEAGSDEVVDFCQSAHVAKSQLAVESHSPAGLHEQADVRA